MTPVSTRELRKLCFNCLISGGYSLRSASAIARSLVENESQGYLGHGILRVFDYLDDLKALRIDPSAKPYSESERPNKLTIHGNSAPNDFVIRHIVRESSRLTRDFSGWAQISLRGCHHLGRLSALGKRLAMKRIICMGFFNYSGAGRLVIPHHGAEGRFCTNPILFGFPGTSEFEPVVVDFSTSEASEGSIRSMLIAGREVDDGKLVDRSGMSVSDPRRLYDGSAWLTPFGNSGKGYALMLAVEILAGIIGGAGDVSQQPSSGSNGGLLMVASLDSVTTGDFSYFDRLGSLVRFIKQTPPNCVEEVRIPGHKKIRPDQLTIPDELYEKLLTLGSGVAI